MNAELCDGNFIRFDDLCTLLVGHGFEFVDRRGPRWEYTARFRQESASCDDRKS